MSDYLHHLLKVVGPQASQLFGAGMVGTTDTTSVAGELNDKLWMYRMRRNGNAAVGTARLDCGPAPTFHHLLDPTTVASQYSVVYENIVQAAVALGDCRTFWGFTQFLTTGVANTLCGVGFYADPSDNKLHSFVSHTTTGAAPATFVHDTASAVLQTSPHRIKFIIDGPTKTVSFYIDNTLLSSYTPGAALDRMALTADINGPRVMHGAFVPANGDVSIRAFAGSLPLVRFKVKTNHGTPPSSGGGGMWLSVT